MRLRAGYTFVASDIVESTSPDSPVFQPGQSLFRRPRHSGFAGVSWAWRRVIADVNGVVVGQYVDSDFSSFNPPILMNPGYTTWNARLSFDVTTRLRALAVGRQRERRGLHGAARFPGARPRRPRRVRVGF